jgi:pyruvate ferredoxin oxidoreductase beta subunit
VAQQTSHMSLLGKVDHRSFDSLNSLALEIGKLAVYTCVCPLYVVVEGNWLVTYRPRQKRPVLEYLALQGRSSRLFEPGNEYLVERIRAEVDRNWPRVQALMLW